MSRPNPAEVVEGSMDSGRCVTAALIEGGGVQISEWERLLDGSWWCVNDYKEIELSREGARKLACRVLEHLL